jgi:hypothetical protein
VNCWNYKTFWLCCVAAVSLFVSAAQLSADDTNLEQEVQLLRKPNAILQQQLQKQSQLLDTLTQKVQALEAASADRESSTSENGEVKVDFVFGVKNLLQY